MVAVREGSGGRVSVTDDVPVGSGPEEVRLDEPTRSARLEWVVVVDEALPAGRAVSAAVCVSAATATGVAGLLGPGATDTGGSVHPGLHVADMPAPAQTDRVHQDHLDDVARAGREQLEHLAVSIVGPRNRVGRIVATLRLLA